MPNDPNQRKFERLVFYAEAALEFSSGKYQARISEISLGGCFVDTIASAVSGEPIALTITAGSAGSQHFTGDIAYTLTGFGFGIRFKDLTEEQIVFLRKIVD